MQTTDRQPKEVSAETLREYLPTDLSMVMVVSYRSGAFAMRLDVSDILVLIRHNQVFGVIKKGFVKSVRLAVSIHAAFRTLAACRIGSETRQGVITKKRNRNLDWAQRFDRAKSGHMGGFKQRQLAGAYERVMEAVPGGWTPVERRICA